MIRSKPRFVLKEPKAEGETLIYLLFRIHGQRLKYSTGLSVDPKYWDDTSQSTILNSDAAGHIDYAARGKLDEIEYWLQKFRTVVDETVKSWKYLKQVPTLERLREALDQEFRQRYVADPESKSLLDYVQRYIDTAKFTKTDPPRRISPETLRKYSITLGHLKGFANTYNKGRLDFADITMQFYWDFIEYLETVRGQGSNTVGKNIGVLIGFMNSATDEGINTNLEYQNRKFRAFKEPVYNPYLTEEELEKMYLHDFSKDPRLERTRDVFMIGCRTALRYSDYSTLGADNINGSVLNLRMVKTGREVFVPVHPWVKEILAKYNNKLPRPISNQKFNDYLKLVAQDCEIDAPVRISKTKRGKPFTKVYPKWQLITSHTARRTGATLMYKAGVPALSIMKITGHTTEHNFLKYIKLTDEEHARHMAGHAYFGGAVEPEK